MDDKAMLCRDGEHLFLWSDGVSNLNRTVRANPGERGFMMNGANQADLRKEKGVESMNETAGTLLQNGHSNDCCQS